MILTCNANQVAEVLPRVAEGDTFNGDFVIVNVYDLTQMFGSGNEPTLEQCQQIFTDYIPYNEGEIVNADVEKVVSKGRNLWDEQWARGTIAVDGTFSSADQNRIRCVNYIDVEPNTTYTFVKPYNGYYALYDRNKNFIGRYTINTSQKTFTTTSDTRYLGIAFGNGSTDPLTEYKNNVAIIKGNNIDASYIPYSDTIETEVKSIITKYFPTGMKSAGNVHDLFDIENGVAVQNVGSTTIGSLSWNLTSGASSPSGKIFKAVLNNKPRARYTKTISSYLCTLQMIAIGLQMMLII